MIRRRGESSSGDANAGGKPSRMIVLAEFAGPVFCLACSTLYHPLHAYSVFVIACLAGMPLWLGALFLCWRVFYGSGPLLSALDPWHRMMLVISLALMAPGLIFLLNGALDREAPVEKRVPVIDKSVMHGRHGDYYHAFTEDPLPALLKLPFDSREKFYLNDLDQYNAIHPGINQAVFAIKPGFLGFPWIVSLNLIQPAPAGDAP
jgi:hypothetical protein